MARTAKTKAEKDAEHAIARRLSEIRAGEGLSLAALGDILEVEREILANYELRRSYLPPSFGIHLCRSLNVSMHWLAHGRGPARPYIPPEEVGIFSEVVWAYRGTFLDCCKAVLYDRYEEWYRRPRASETYFKEGFTSWAKARQNPALLHHCATLLNRLVAGASTNEVLGIEGQLLTIIEELRNRTIRKLNGADDILWTGELQIATPATPSTWTGLRSVLATKTKKRGQKVALANYIGVSRSAVSKYLTGKSAPSAEITLKITEWLKLTSV